MIITPRDNTDNNNHNGTRTNIFESDYSNPVAKIDRYTRRVYRFIVIYCTLTSLTP